MQAMFPIYKRKLNNSNAVKKNDVAAVVLALHDRNIAHSINRRNGIFGLHTHRTTSDDANMDSILNFESTSVKMGPCEAFRENLSSDEATTFLDNFRHSKKLKLEEIMNETLSAHHCKSSSNFSSSKGEDAKDPDEDDSDINVEDDDFSMS
uniref:Uncharacterized protein n=1 Tax=Romanomermis culicivorax TaxID=13658 RepID=A0A915KSL4_ROMCU